MEVIRNLIIDIGLSATTIILILILLRSILQKVIEKMIDNIIEEKSNKNIEKYINDLKRKTLVYEKIVKRELEFYDKVENYISDIVVEIQDVEIYYYNFINADDEERIETNKKKFLNELEKIIEKIPIYKKDVIMFGNYIDDEIKKASVKLLCELQESVIEISNIMQKNETKKVELEKIAKETLMNSCIVMDLIKKRYQNLSDADN